MKKLIVFISLMITVFSLSGCTIGKLDEMPPKAIDKEYIEESVDKGTELGDLTSNYFWDVLGVFGIERKSGAEIGKEIGEKIPSGAEIGKEIGEKVPNSSEVVNKVNENLPTGQEIKENIWDITDTLKEKTEEVFTNIDDELSDTMDKKSKSETSIQEEKIEDTEFERELGTDDFD